MTLFRRWAPALALAVMFTTCAWAEGFNSAGVYQFSASDVDNTVFAESEAQEQSENQAQTPQGVPIPSATLSPQVAELPWNLMLVNGNNPVPDNWEVDLVTLYNGRRVDRRILPDLQAMFDACRAAGLKPTVYTAYRTYEDQQDMLMVKYRQYKNQGKSTREAQIAALKVAAYPGYSEHQLGLAVDIDSANTKVCSNESVWKWVINHCHEYGFIWRYPSVKTEITGISNENWHFRYVGVEAATYIMENQLCLEEYLQEAYGIPY